MNKRLILPGLIVGSFIPDIEVPFLMIFFQGILPDHFFLHSLVGALTIGTALSVFITIYIYPVLVSWIFKLDRNKVNQLCKLSPFLILSCILGNVFHILLDIPMHPFNPVLWPFVDPYKIVGFLVLLLAPAGDISIGFFRANILTNLITGLFGIAILLKSRNNFWEKILVGK